MINAINGVPVFVTELKLKNTDKMIEVLKSQDIVQDKGDEWFGDSDGELNKPQLHNLPEFEEFNKAIQKPVREYVEAIMSKRFYGGAKLNIYAQKSWGVKLKSGGGVHSHRHCNGHVSLVYYLQTPEGSASLQFPSDSGFDTYNPFTTAGVTDGIPQVQVKSGMLVIFPSSAMHQALNNESVENRYSISYDLSVTTPEARQFMMLDPKFWKLLD